MTDNNFNIKKLSRDSEENTIIMAGHVQFRIKDLEDEINADSEIGKKLRSVEEELKKYQ